MPHDKNGTELRANDFVIIRAIVRAVHLTEDACNVDLVVHDPRGRNQYLPAFTCNSSLVEKVGSRLPRVPDSAGEVDVMPRGAEIGK